MTVKECYERCGGDYSTMISRLLSDQVISRFLSIFQRDDNFEKLGVAMGENNGEEAFKAAHAVKGVANNMAFNEFADVIEALTDELRPGQCTLRSQELYEQAKPLYEKIIESIKAFQEA